MNELNDDDIQRLLEIKPSTSTKDTLPVSEDVTAYRRLFDELKKEPPGGLSPNFSLNIVSQIRTKKYTFSDVLFYVLIGTGALLSLSFGFVIAAGDDPQAANALLTSLNDAKFWLIFGLASIVVVQVLDHKLLTFSLLAEH